VKYYPLGGSQSPLSSSRHNFFWCSGSERLCAPSSDVQLLRPLPHPTHRVSRRRAAPNMGSPRGPLRRSECGALLGARGCRRHRTLGTTRGFPQAPQPRPHVRGHASAIGIRAARPATVDSARPLTPLRSAPSRGVGDLVPLEGTSWKHQALAALEGASSTESGGKVVARAFAAKAQSRYAASPPPTNTSSGLKP